MNSASLSKDVCHGCKSMLWHTVVWALRIFMVWFQSANLEDGVNSKACKADIAACRQLCPMLDDGKWALILAQQPFVHLA